MGMCQEKYQHFKKIVAALNISNLCIYIICIEKWAFFLSPDKCHTHAALCHMFFFTNVKVSKKLLKSCVSELTVSNVF